MALPSSFRKLVVKSLTTNFAKATEIVADELPRPNSNEVLIRNMYLGINATDINITGGKYAPYKTAGFVPGLESVGEVVGVGSDVNNFKIGQPVAYMGFGGFTEYLCVVPESMLFNIPEVKPEYLALLVCGKTATIGLDQVGRIKEGEKVLITAAAGGTGHIAVQHAKSKGCHVLGLCSTEEKAAFLREHGCDRVINYKTEALSDVLQKEYPTGIDVVWETVGGDVFNQCVFNLAIKGRLIIVGYITHYKSQSGYRATGLEKLPEALLANSATLSGFLLFHHKNEHAAYHTRLLDSYKRKKIKIKLDNGENLPQGVFKGLESVARAVEYLHSGKSIGKVYVEI